MCVIVPLQSAVGRSAHERSQNTRAYTRKGLGKSQFFAGRCVANHARMRRALLVLMLVGGCSSPAQPEGPVAQSITQAAARNGVPRDLMVAIAVTEGGLLLPKTRILRLD